MLSSLVSVGALLLPLTAAQFVGSNSSNKTSPVAAPDANGKYWIYGKGIRAAFIPYGASITDLIVKDQYGIERDLILGFENATAYTLDKTHAHLGGVPGRYANRIKNSTFVIDGQTYHVEPNEHPTAENPKGVNQLHGGPNGWDWRNFTVEAATRDSITFKIVDPDGEQGFPGEVIAYVTYELGDMEWNWKIVAISTTKKTPIHATSHPYWNLDGFANNETETMLNHTFYLPYSGQRVEVDNILIPTGNIVANHKGSVNDFWSAPKQIGADFNKPELLGNCGFNCTGYDNCWLVNRAALGPYNWRTEGPVATLHSAWSGIQMDIYSDQDAFQMYSCVGANNYPRKKSQGGKGVIPAKGCYVLEVQDWIDSINHPEWMREKKHIYGPGDNPYVLQASYRFSINSTKSTTKKSS